MVTRSRAKTSSPTLSAARRKALLPAIKARLAASVLPGDTAFDDDELQSAAELMLDTAQFRKEGEPSIGIQTASGERRVTQIAIINRDMPFLVDSMAQTIAAEGLSIDRLVHPVVPVRRTDDGLIDVIPEGEGVGEPLESMVFIETERVDARTRRAMHKALKVTLGDVRAAVSDWARMREVMAEDAKRVPDSEGAALLRWLNDGMLTQLGHITRKRNGRNSGSLGICRKSAKTLLADSSIDRAFAWFDDTSNGKGRAPLIVKANRLSHVHRRVPLDLFIIPIVEDGRVEAISIHAGVWTSAALASPPAQVPRLRAQLASLMQSFGFDTAGHAGKSLTHAMTVLPHDLAVSFSDKQLQRVVATLMSLEDRPRPRLAVVEAPLKRHLFAFVWFPRDLISTMVRSQVQRLLEDATDATLLDWSVEVEGGNLAMLRFVLDIRDGAAPPDDSVLEEQLQAMLRGWGEAVETELAKGEDGNRAAVIAARYADLFPAQYRMKYGPSEAAIDITRIRRIGTEADQETNERQPPRDARLYRLESDKADVIRLKIYQLRGSVPLSDAVPALENFGFRVLAENPTELGEGEHGTIHDFLLALNDGSPLESLDERREVIEQAIAAVMNGKSENDSFNRLIIGTELAAVEANWLRAIYRYLRQTGLSYTIYTVVDALDNAPDVTRAIISLFKALNDPKFSGNRDHEAATLRGAIRDGLAQVSAINDDRLLRQYHAVVEAILRTNAFVAAGDAALAFKIDSAGVPGLPKPVPWREIFVYSERVEGVHLRAGPVARGGLRWSDRRDDFRTEILGLMKAQRVKNAVIVPTGAKGGFYPKQLPDPAKDRAAWADEGRASYELFITTLLSLTDNLDGDRVIHPKGMVIRDGDDPYFVVAADKGTATFSDVANAIAIKHQFWLDDAFASGGSVGYDHKAMGITARGAWVSVQRHFLEMGIDVQSEPVRVAGCGDMSGDVFGNGMLLSKAIKLIAAFDHRHIFFDPEPDPAVSWKERKRLFGLPRSSWEDYNHKLISKGGGVFARSMKQIPLSPEIQEMLGVEESELDPDSLISAILKAEVDLLWFGGIGTYVKSSTENNVQVGDPANDALRVSGNEVRAKVVGEGANLGVTQAGRVEFALNGGRINTDFIDNSAGVDCSDNEVNIKIALAPARRSGKLSDTKRAELLESMTADVADIVLEDNRLQALALSVAAMGGERALSAETRLIERLEERGALDRRNDGLPDNQGLARRAMEHAGLTRPELAVLLSSAKLVLQDAIEDSDLPNDPGLADVLLAAFPQKLQDSYREDVLKHRLRSEIIATKIANGVVNRLGIIHPFEVAEEEGVDLAQIAASFVCAQHIFELPDLWDKIDSAAMPEDARLELLERTAAAVANLMADLLRAGAGQVPPSETIAKLGEGMAQLSRDAATLVGEETRKQGAMFQQSLVERGAPNDLVGAIAHLHALDGSAGLARLAYDSGVDAVKLTAAFTDLGSRLGLDWAQGTAAMMNTSDVWERMLVSSTARDFQQMRLDFLARQELGGPRGVKSGKIKDPLNAVADWAEAHAPAIEQFRAMIKRAQAQNPVPPTVLAQLASQARNLLAR